MRILAIALVAAIVSVSAALAAEADSRVDDAQRGFRTPRFDALAARIDSIANRSDDWSGSLRYSWRAVRRGENRFTQGAGGPAPYGSVDFRLGYECQLSDELTLGFRLRAVNKLGFGGDAFRSDLLGNGAGRGSLGFGGFGIRETRGMGGGDLQGLGLDRAYVRYTPDWAGTYETEDGEDAPRMEVTAGAS